MSPRRTSAAALLVAAVTVIGACAARAARPLRLAPAAGLDLFMPVPAHNPLTYAAVLLGERLFFDTRLSRDGTLACSSCHQPARAFTDGMARSAGISGRSTARNAPTLHNRAWATALTWDGRVESLESQVLRPIVHADEMGLPMTELLARLRADADYVRAFRQAFGDRPTGDGIARALASYVRTLRSGDAPFDRYRAGDTLALSAPARRGLRLFVGRGSCSSCHTGPDLSDGGFHNTGVAWRGGYAADVGRFRVTADSADLGAFRTPILRDIVLTAPYMHDGSIATLEDVIEFYDRGGSANPRLDPVLRPLGLGPQEKRDLLHFLHALTGTLQPVR